MKQKLVVGNWKMHGSLAANARLLLDVVDGAPPDVAVAVCLPYPYLFQAQELLDTTPVAWGAQNVSEHEAGAHTGEVSAAMLAEFGVRYVIVGHSERRAHHAERDAQVAAKVRQVLVSGMTPILCVGETLAERDAGQEVQVVRRQMEAVHQVVGATAWASMVLAYEPVWAIGTGRSASPEQAQAMHAALRTMLRELGEADPGQVSLLYGGSVKPANTAQLRSQPDIDGFLVGGASLVADEFLAICTAAAA